MSKWESRGYAPGSDPERERTRQVEEELLREYLPIILAQSSRIIETPRYFFCRLVSAWLSTWFLYRGGGPIPLGVLCLLWETGEMVFECPACRRNLHATGVGGSPLSGWATVWGVCAGCHTWQRRPDGSGSRAIHAVGRLLEKHRNEPVIERGRQPRFDWKEGLKGDSTPDRVIVPSVKHMDLATLVRDIANAGGPEQPSRRGAVGPNSVLDGSRSRAWVSPILLGRKRT
jgi:hypothetical protein